MKFITIVTLQLQASLKGVNGSFWVQLDVWLLQVFPPVVEAELQTFCFLSSIFIEWFSAHDSLDMDETPRTVLLPGLMPLDKGMRVELLLGCTSEHDWQECREDCW